MPHFLAICVYKQDLKSIPQFEGISSYPNAKSFAKANPHFTIVNNFLYYEDIIKETLIIVKAQTKEIAKMKISETKPDLHIQYVGSEAIDDILQETSLEIID